MRTLRALGFAFTTILMYLGVSLLGWGLGDWRGFFGNPARAGYAMIILAMAIAIGFQAYQDPQGIRGGRDEKGKRVGRQSVVRYLMIFVLYAALFLLPFADRRGIATLPELQWVRWIGCVLSGIGLWFIFWSGVALGRMYSPEVTVQKDHHLVTSGSYQVIRHPRYLGVVLMTFGMPALYRSWIGLLLTIPILLILLFRIRDEEAFMAQAFGEEWEDYCKRSWRLLPFIY